jgi:hypothetical protein
MNIPALVSIIRARHYANSGAPESVIEAFEKACGYALPADMREFYGHCNGARLFDAVDPPYEILPLDQVRRANDVFLMGPEGERAPESWFVFCDVRDGNYVGIDFRSTEPGVHAILDLFHETFPKPAYMEVIAHSFEAFLDGALKSDGQGLYWITQA